MFQQGNAAETGTIMAAISAAQDELGASLPRRSKRALDSLLSIAKATDTKKATEFDISGCTETYPRNTDQEYIDGGYTDMSGATCDKAFDGVLEISGAFKCFLPCEAEFALAGKAKVNGLRVISGTGQSDKDYINNFTLTVKVNGAWVTPANAKLDNSVTSMVDQDTCKICQCWQRILRISFDEIDNVEAFKMSFTEVMHGDRVIVRELDVLGMSASEDANTSSTYNSISEVLTDVNDIFRSSQVQDQAQLEWVVGQIENIAVMGDERFENLTTFLAGKRGEHETCRDEEELLFDEDATKCHELVTYLTNLGGVDCQNPAGTRDKSGAWTEFLNQGYAFFSSAEVSYPPKRDACVDSSEALHTKILACDAKQAGYEDDFCEWREFRTTQCDDRSHCYEECTTKHEGHVDVIMPRADQRVKESRVLSYVQCLMDDNKKGGREVSGVCIEVRDDDYSDYNNTPPTVKELPPCDMSMLSPYPGMEAFGGWAYHMLSANTPHDPNTGVACV